MLNWLAGRGQVAGMGGRGGEGEEVGEGEKRGGRGGEGEEGGGGGGREDGGGGEEGGEGGYHAAFLWPQLFRPVASIDYSKPQSGLPHVPGNTTHLQNG